LRRLFVGHGFGRELIEFAGPGQGAGSGMPDSPTASRPR
jgi:hypothetical protein